MRRFTLFLMAAIGSACVAHAEITQERMLYRDGDTELEGLLVYDDTQESPRPGVLIYHAWGGPGPHERQTAEKLAERGYVAFVADVYGKGVRPETSAARAREAGKYRAGDDRSLMRSRARAAFDVLAEHPAADREHIAALGYCFGGAVALELARSGAPVTGVASFHGGLATPDPSDAQRIQGRVLALHGADDPHVPVEQVLAFQREMREADIDWQLNTYGGAVHAFTDPNAGSDPSTGAAYHLRSAQRAWKDFLQFMDEQTP